MRGTLNFFFQLQHRDLQGSFQPRILLLMQKELIRRIVRLNNREIKSQKCISINSQIRPTFQCWKTNFKTEVSMFLFKHSFGYYFVDQRSRDKVESVDDKDSVSLNIRRSCQIRITRRESAWRSKKLRCRTDFFEEDRLLMCSTKTSEFACRTRE